MDQVKFVEDSLQKIWSDIVCLGRLSSTNFTWSILEYLDPNDVISLPDRKKNWKDMTFPSNFFEKQSWQI